MCKNMRIRFIFGLLVTLHGSTQLTQRIRPVIYEMERSESWYPFEITENNAINYVDIIRNTRQDIVIFPEYGLTTMEIVQRAPDHLDDYSVVLPEKIGTDICKINEGYNTNEKALKIIGCGAKKYKKHVIFHVLEKNGDFFYSTVVYVDQDGVMQHLYRKEKIYEEGDSIKKFEGNQTNIFVINGFNLQIMMGYDFFMTWNVVPDTNIVYFSPLRFQMPLFYDVSFLFPLSKEYSLNVYSPALIGCVWPYDEYCARNSTVFIENGIYGHCRSRNGSEDDINTFTYMNKYIMNFSQYTPITDNTTETDFCRMDIENYNSEVEKEYGFISYLGPIKFSRETFNLTICVLVKVNISKYSPEINFNSIRILNKMGGLSVATTLSIDLLPIDYKLETFDNNVRLFGRNLKDIVAFGIISKPEDELRNRNIAEGKHFSSILFILAIIINIEL